MILTTAANISMEPVHDRMPLILERKEIAEWMLDDAKTEKILHKPRVCWSGRQIMSS